MGAPKRHIASLSGAEKAAVLLLAMGEEHAPAILAGMPRAEAQRVVVALGRLGRVEQEVVDQVLLELSSRIGRAPERGVTGDAHAAKRLLGKALGAGGLEVALDLGSPAMEETLAGVLPADLARHLAHEHPQTTALVLAHLDPKRCGATLKLLPQSLHTEILTRLARLEAVGPEILLELADTLKMALAQTRSAGARKGGAAPVAAALASLPDAERKRALDALEARDAELAAEVRALMFSFEDLARLAANALIEIVAKTPEASLKLALRGVDEAMLAAFCGAMSSRRAEALREELAGSAKAKLADVEAARRQMASLARQLIDEGKIQGPEGTDDPYV